MPAYLPNIISTISGFIPFAVAMFVWERLGRDLLVLASLLGLYIVSDLISMTMALQGVRNLWFLNCVCCLDFSLFLVVFSLWEPEQGRRLLLGLIPVALIGWFLTQWLAGGVTAFNYVGRSLQSIVLVGLSIRTLHRLAIEGEVVLWRDPRFWVALGVLVNFSGSTFAYALGFLMEQRFMVAIWPLHLASSILANLLFTGGFLCLHKPSPTGG